MVNMDSHQPRSMLSHFDQDECESKTIHDTKTTARMAQTTPQAQQVWAKQDIETQTPREEAPHPVKTTKVPLGSAHAPLSLFQDTKVTDTPKKAPPDLTWG